MNNVTTAQIAEISPSKQSFLQEERLLAGNGAGDFSFAIVRLTLANKNFVSCMILACARCPSLTTIRNVEGGPSLYL